MTDKSGGDAHQANQAMQANANWQDVNSVGAAGAGILEGTGGMAEAVANAAQNTNQNQAQNNQANTGQGGDDNINANTTVNL